MSTSPDRVWRGIKLALCLMGLPVFYFVPALVFHWPLPTFAVNVLTGHQAEYWFFMVYSTDNIRGSAVFISLCLTASSCLIIFTYPKLAHELKNNFASVFAPKEKPGAPSSAPPVVTAEHLNPQPWYRRTARTTASHRVPETSP